MQKLITLCLITVCRLVRSDESFVELGKDINYSYLAREAEVYKKDLLKFLNQTKIVDKYKELYYLLLVKLLDSTTSQTRRGSTRRIVSGRNTSIAAVPWQVSLREKTYPICGGSIVTDVWILTAAHCLIRPKASELSIRVGSSWKTHGGEIYDVKECFIHPRYVSRTKVNDVGLLRLYTPLRFSARVLPIKVVAAESRLPAGVPAVVSGWGKLREGGPSATNLQSSTIKTIAMKLCRWSGLDRKAIDPASMFCAGSFSHLSPDACQGDSGGPIAYDGVLVGVVSWGLGCARGNFPGVYTRLASPVIWQWIHKIIAVQNDNNSFV